MTTAAMSERRTLAVRLEAQTHRLETVDHRQDAMGRVRLTKPDVVDGVSADFLPPHTPQLRGMRSLYFASIEQVRYQSRRPRADERKCEPCGAQLDLLIGFAV